MLKIGMMQDFRNPKEWRRPNPELYSAILDQIVRAEELGYDNVWLTEHHFADDGYNPSLLPTAAAIATRTHRIRIGTFVLLCLFSIRCALRRTRPASISGPRGASISALARAIHTKSSTLSVCGARNVPRALPRASKY